MADASEYVSVQVIRADALYDTAESFATGVPHPFEVGHRMRVTLGDATEMVARGVARIAEDN